MSAREALARLRPHPLGLSSAASTVLKDPDAALTDPGQSDLPELSLGRTGPQRGLPNISEFVKHGLNLLIEVSHSQ